MSCFKTCQREACHQGAPCVKEAQPSGWVEIEPDLPIDVAEPDREPIDRRWFAVLLVVMILLWSAIYWRFVL